MEDWQKLSSEKEEDCLEKKSVDSRNDYGDSNEDNYQQQILEKTRLAFAAHAVQQQTNINGDTNAVARHIAKTHGNSLDISTADRSKHEDTRKQVKKVLEDSANTQDRYLDYLRTAQPPQWVPDNCKQAKSCGSCGKRFDWIRRKHHCRFCGSVFCAECISFRSLLPVNFGVRRPEKVCEVCNQKLVPLQAELIETNSLQHRLNEKYDADSYARHFNSPYRRTLSGEIRKAAYALKNCFTGPIKDQSITETVLAKAKGLAFITIAKGGFIVAGRGGTGLVVAKLEDGTWSAPSAIGSMGISWGLQIGGDCCDFIIVLNTKAAVESFSTKGMVGRIGGSGGLTLGLGRKMEGDLVGSKKKMLAHTYTYARSKGMFAGVAIEVSAIKTRNKLNRQFYGYDVDPADLLSGKVNPPVAAKPLYDELRCVYQFVNMGKDTMESNK